MVIFLSGCTFQGEVFIFITCRSTGRRELPASNYLGGVILSLCCSIIRSCLCHETWYLSQNELWSARVIAITSLDLISMDMTCKEKVCRYKSQLHFPYIIAGVISFPLYWAHKRVIDFRLKPVIIAIFSLQSNNLGPTVRRVCYQDTWRLLNGKVAT